MLQLVFATDKNAGFGLGDGFPWGHIPEDLKQFKANTQGTVLVMGAKTFSTLPGLLPGREHIVLADLDRPLPVAKNGCTAHKYLPASDIEAYFEKWKANDDQVYSVIGGAQILYRAFAYADKVIHTVICPKGEQFKKADVYLNDYMYNKLMNREHSFCTDVKTDTAILYTFTHEMES